jgi:hypothetical protein
MKQNGGNLKRPNDETMRDAAKRGSVLTHPEGLSATGLVSRG